MQNILRKIAGVLGLALLAGCTITPVAPEDRAGWTPRSGGSLTLNQVLQIPAEQAGVYIQNGEIYSRVRDVDIYLPYCRFEVKRDRDAFSNDFEVARGEFRVRKSWTGVDYSGTTGFSIFASASIFPPIHWAGSSDDERIPVWLPQDNERPMENLTTYIALESSEQPAVSGLNCSVFADLVHYNFLSLNEIRGTLGEVATLRLSGQ